MLILHTDSLPKHDFYHIFSFVKKAGYDGVEIGINSKKLDSCNAEYLQEVSRETGVRIRALEITGDITKKKMKLAYEIVQAVEADVITINPPSYFNYGVVSWLKNNVPKMRSQANIHVSLLNMPDKRLLLILPKYSLNSQSDLRKFQEVTFDPSNLVTHNMDVLEFYTKMKKYIYHVYLSNCKGNRSHVLPEEGRVPLESLFKKMKKDNYHGYFSLKVNAKELSDSSDKKVISKLKKVKAFYEESFL